MSSTLPTALLGAIKIDARPRSLTKYQYSFALDEQGKAGDSPYQQYSRK